MATDITKILEIVGRLDERTKAIQEDVAEASGRLNSHSKRLGSLERYRAGLVSVTTALVVAVAWALNWAGGTR